MRRKINCIMSILFVYILCFTTLVQGGEWTGLNSSTDDGWRYPVGSFSSANNSWAQKLSRMGYCEGTYGSFWNTVAKEPDTPIFEGKKYNVSFNLKATKDKWVFFKISNNDDSECNICKWIDLKKDKTQKIKLSFKAKYSFSNVYFCCSGVGSLKSGTLGYKYKPPYTLDSRLGSNYGEQAVTITCTKFSLKEAKQAKLSKSSIALKKGKTKVITMKNAISKVKWSVLNKKIVSIKKKGKYKILIRGLKKGKTAVWALYKGKIYKCKVKVK